MNLDSKAKNAAADSSKVRGFSLRFNELLGLARVQDAGRFAWGAKRYSVAFNTFKNWCSHDTAPKFGVLEAVVLDLLSLINANISSSLIIGWLYSGSNNPFLVKNKPTVDYPLLNVVYQKCNLIAKENDVYLTELSRKSLDSLMKTVINHVESSGQSESIRIHEKNNELDPFILGCIAIISLAD
jgi:hypothetical protein